MLFGRSLLFDSDVVVHNVRTAQSGNNSPKSGVFRTSSRWFDLKLGLNEYSLFFSSNNCRLSLVGCCSEISRGCFHFSFGCFCCSNLLLKCWLLLSFFFQQILTPTRWFPNRTTTRTINPAIWTGTIVPFEIMRTTTKILTTRWRWMKTGSSFRGNPSIRPKNRSNIAPCIKNWNSARNRTYSFRFFFTLCLCLSLPFVITMALSILVPKPSMRRVVLKHSSLCYRSLRRLDSLCSPFFEIWSKETKKKKNLFGVSPIMWL